MPSHRAVLRFTFSLATWLMLVGCATTPTAYREPAALPAADRTTHNLAVFDRAWSLVNDKYFDATFHGVDWAAMRARYRPDAAAALDEEELYRVLNRMAAELRDRHVHAISPRRAYEGHQRHAMDFGIRELVLSSGRTVTTIVPGSPADAAGVRVGWRILSPEAAQLDSARAVGQAISFSFLDEHDQPHTLDLSPTLLPFDNLRTDSRLVADGVLYLRFDTFSHATISWLSRELKRHLAVPAVVIDLRENPGGDSTALQIAAREFFPEGRQLGRTLDRAGVSRRLDTLSVFSARYPGKVIILVSETTASAAEIFARALQFHQRATVLGRRTAGSVVEGFKHRLPDGGYMNVAEQDFIDLAGQRLEGRGVTPDILTPLPTLADLRTSHDRTLEAALRLLAKIESTP